MYRVLHLIHSRQRRGAEVFASQLARSLEEKGLFENAVCSLYDGEGDLPLNGLPVFWLGAREGLLDRKLGLNPWTVSRMQHVLRRFQPHVLLAHGGDTLKYAALGRTFYRRTRAVYRNIGVASSWVSSPAGVGLNKLLLRGMDAVVSVSQYTRQDFVRLYGLPPQRVVFIPNGVDPSEFDACAQGLARAEVRRELGLSQAHLALITVGNLSPEKGHEGLLTLMADRHGGAPDSHLLLVGDGPLRQKLGELAGSLGLHRQVHFLGRRSDVPRLLAAADLFVLPSKSEGMPAVLIEAGLTGLASVAFDVGGVGEVVEDGVTGLLATPGDFRELGRTIRELSNRPEQRAAMGVAARRRCRQSFDIRQVVVQYEALFLELLQTPVEVVSGTS